MGVNGKQKFKATLEGTNLGIITEFDPVHKTGIVSFNNDDITEQPTMGIEFFDHQIVKITDEYIETKFGYYFIDSIKDNASNPHNPK